MIKTIAFAVRPDEMDAFERYSAQLDLEVELVDTKLSMDTVHLTKGYKGVVFFGMCDLSEAVLIELHKNGVQYIASRSAGYNNVDVSVAKKLGIKVSNASYSPHCVADFTVMMILMSIRKMKSIMKRVIKRNYALAGIQGKEMHNLTFGVIGTGKIGSITAQSLKGFGGKILAYNPSQKDELKDIVEYVSLERLLKESDVITLHAPLNSSSHHIIDSKALSITKKGLVLVNCARGELMDTQAVIQYLDSGHISSLALDVLEDELGVFHVDHSNGERVHETLEKLKTYENVIISPHASFFTDQAVSDMVEVALRSIESFITRDLSPDRVA